jgi:ECF sigma factor
MNEVTRILSAIEQGDPKAAAELLLPVYQELRTVSVIFVVAAICNIAIN